jgi:hypothetical protein
MKTWKQSTCIGIMAILVFIFTLVACDNGNENDNGNDNNDKVDNHTHTWNAGVITISATCMEKGLITFTCTVNSSHTKTEEIAIDHDAHNYGLWLLKTVATCTDDEKEERVCSYNTSHKETRNNDSSPAFGHTPNTETGICSVCNGLTYSIGDNGPGGGKIFYISEEGFTMTDTTLIAHYLEASPIDMPNPNIITSFPQLKWATTSYYTIDIIGTETAIGTGRKNTALILSRLTVIGSAPAAEACKAYVNNGKTDWFLPSLAELRALYQQKNLFPNSNWNHHFYETYWSSTQSQYNNNQAGYKVFDSPGGLEYYWDKNTDNSVRAIRAF